MRALRSVKATVTAASAGGLGAVAVSSGSVAAGTGAGAGAALRRRERERGRRATAPQRGEITAAVVATRRHDGCVSLGESAPATEISRLRQLREKA